MYSFLDIHMVANAFALKISINALHISVQGLAVQKCVLAVQKLWDTLLYNTALVLGNV